MKVYWKTPASGDFFVAANWNTDQVPDYAYIAAMTIAGTYTVTDSISTTVLGITTGASTTFALAGGTTFTATEGTATGANRGTIMLADDATLNAGGTVDNTGAINVDSGEAGSFLDFVTSTVLQGRRCPGFGKQKPHKVGKNDRVEYDHLIPYSRGGSSSVMNIQVLCMECNRALADRRDHASGEGRPLHGLPASRTALFWR